MSLAVSDYLDLRRDSRWERDLAQRLRHEPESRKLEFIEGLMRGQSVVALDLARKCLTDRKSYESILLRGLSEADASSIREWLECVVPRLGFRRVMKILRSAQVNNPEGVRKARYWLAGFSQLPGYSASELNSI